VAVGTPDLWDQSLALPNVESKYGSYTWSPCGQFVAVQTEEAVEIRNPLSFELLSTLQPTEPTSQLMGKLAYSPDGHSLASLSNTSLIIWDIQTGGVAKEFPCDKTSRGSVVWSLNGGTICTIGQDWDQARLRHHRVVHDLEWTIYTYDSTSGTRLSTGQLRSDSMPHLWAHNTSLQAATIRQGGKVHVIRIFEVGSALNRINSFRIDLGTRNIWAKFFSRWGQYEIISFSPATYRISMVSMGSYENILILDIQDSHCLLNQKKRYFFNHSFSSDGSLFSASSGTSVHIWKYSSGHYTPWREFPSFHCVSPCFSPTLSSILGLSEGVPQIWRLDGPPITAHINYGHSLLIPSPCGTYVVTGHQRNSVITITNLLSQTPHFIKTGMKISTFTLTGNVLLVEDSKTIAAWRLTGEGAVEGIFGNQRAGQRNRIWTIPQSPVLEFVVEDQTVTIQDGVNDRCIQIYHAGTGEVLKPTQAPLYNPHHWDANAMQLGQHYPHYHRLNKHNTCPEDSWPVSQTMFKEGWVKDPEGKHQLWIPGIWRQSQVTGGWLYNIRTLWIRLNDGDVVIKF
jgi:hypothetical protein